jgi:hypothetical protein
MIDEIRRVARVLVGCAAWWCAQLGGGTRYNAQLTKNCSLLSIFGMTLAIVAVPYGIGEPLISAMYGGGQLSIFVGLLVVLVLDCCVAVSLAELAS